MTVTLLVIVLFIMSALSKRRRYVDQVLTQTEFSGDVLDVGGKKENKRGTFSPPTKGVTSWKYLNIDAPTNPDYLSGAEKMPIPEKQFDFVLLAETLEHLEKPYQSLSETFRVLRHEGTLVITVPFLYGIHANPNDYQRWTPSKIRKELEGVGFQEVNIKAMGGLVSVIHDLIYVSVSSGLNMKGSLFGKFVRRIFLPFVAVFEKQHISSSEGVSVTTGYYVLAIKK